MFLTEAIRTAYCNYDNSKEPFFLFAVVSKMFDV
jgi:hypothetical protein